MSEIFQLSALFGYFGAILIGYVVTYLITEYFKEVNFRMLIILPMILGMMVFASGYFYVMNYKSMVEKWLNENYPEMDPSYKSKQVSEEIARFTQRYSSELWFVQVGLSMSFVAGGYVQVARFLVSQKR